MKVVVGDEYEFKKHRNRTECPSFDTVWVLLHRTWVAEQSNIMDLSDTLVARTSGEPLVHQKNAIDPLFDRFFRRILYRTFVMRKKVGDFSKRVFFIQDFYCALGRMTVSLQSSFSPIPNALDTHKNPVKTVFLFS